MASAPPPKAPGAGGIGPPVPYAAALHFTAVFQALAVGAALDAGSTLDVLPLLWGEQAPDVLRYALEEQPARWLSVFNVLTYAAAQGPPRKDLKTAVAFSSILQACVDALAGFMLSPACGLGVEAARNTGTAWALTGTLHPTLRIPLLCKILAAFYGSEEAAVAALPPGTALDFLRAMIAKDIGDAALLLARPAWGRFYDAVSPWSLLAQLWKDGKSRQLAELISVDKPTRLRHAVAAIASVPSNCDSALYKFIRSQGADPMSFPAVASAAKYKTLNWMLGACHADAVLYYLRTDEEAPVILERMTLGKGPVPKPAAAQRWQALQKALQAVAAKELHQLTRADVVGLTRAFRAAFPAWGPYAKEPLVLPPLDWTDPALALQTRGLGWAVTHPWGAAASLGSLQGDPVMAKAAADLGSGHGPVSVPPTFAYASTRVPVLVRQAPNSYLRLPPYVPSGHITTLVGLEAAVTTLYGHYTGAKAVACGPTDFVLLGVDSESLGPLTGVDVAGSTRILTVAGGGCVWTIDIHALAANTAATEGGKERAAAAVRGLLTPAAPCPPAVLVHYGGCGSDITALDHLMPYARVSDVQVKVSVSAGGHSGGSHGGAGADADASVDKEAEVLEKLGGLTTDEATADTAAPAPGTPRLTAIHVSARAFSTSLGSLLAARRHAFHAAGKRTPLFVLDLDPVSKAVLPRHPQLLASVPRGPGGAPPPEVRVNGGLAGLCDLVLGAPLCKYWQLSNWARTPQLIPSQHEYACLDAWVLEPLLAIMLS